METILVYNQRVAFLDGYENKYFYPRDKDLREMATTRWTDGLEVPVTLKLIDYFKSHGMVPRIAIGGSSEELDIRVGFKQLDAISSSQEGYVDFSKTYFFGDLLEDANLLHNYNVQLKLDIESLEEEVSECSLKPGVISHIFDMNLDGDLDGQDVTCEHSVSLEFISTEVDDKLLRNWTNPSSKWFITVSVSLILTPNSPDEGETDHLAPLKRMRMDDTYSDFTIIAGSGTVIKCDRNVLAQSPYFDRMFQSGMKESESRTLELPQMSGEGVGAMLDYMYLRKKTEPEANSLICVELLEAGHQYDVGGMEECMKKILLSNPEEWYTPEAALRLILFLKDMDLDDLKVKAIKVLKAKIPEVQTLPTYDELIKENPEVLKQLVNFISAY